MNDDGALAIGVDLGATKIATALVARDGRVVAARTTATQAGDGAAAVCDRIASEIFALIKQSPAKVIGIGVGSPGAIDRERGIVRGAVNLGWYEVPLGDELRRRVVHRAPANSTASARCHPEVLRGISQASCVRDPSEYLGMTVAAAHVAGEDDGDLPVIIDTDANANAVGEGMFGSAVGCDSYVLFTIGSGLGAGVVSGGRLVTGGSEGIAANLGHYALDPEHGRACACGHHGCAETIVSGPALAASTGAASADSVVAEARNGDTAARTAIRAMARALGHVAAVAAAVVDPQVIVIGGGLGAAAFDLLVPPAQTEMYRRLPTSFTGRIAFRRAGLSSPAIGAASLIFSRLDPRQARAGARLVSPSSGAGNTGDTSVAPGGATDSLSPNISADERP